MESSSSSSSSSSAAIAAVSPFELFNRSLIHFLNDMRPLIGKLSEYKLALASAKMMAAADVRQNQAMFEAYVAVPYEQRITSRDESFFMEQYDDQTNVGLVQLLKSAWSSMTPHDQDAVWSHLQVLVVLNRRCKAAGARS